MWQVQATRKVNNQWGVGVGLEVRMNNKEIST